MSSDNGAAGEPGEQPVDIRPLVEPPDCLTPQELRAGLRLARTIGAAAERAGEPARGLWRMRRLVRELAREGRVSPVVVAWWRGPQHGDARVVALEDGVRLERAKRGK